MSSDHTAARFETQPIPCEKWKIKLYSFVMPKHRKPSFVVSLCLRFINKANLEAQFSRYLAQPQRRQGTKYRETIFINSLQ